MDLALILAISIIVSAIIIIVTINVVYGQVFLQEDQAMICLSAVWTNVSNDISCKVFNQDDIGVSDELNKVYDQYKDELDTFDLDLIEK